MASTYNVARLGRIAIKAQSAWGTAETTGFTALECESVLPPTGREIHERYGSTITGGHYHLKPVDGSQFGQEISITMPIHGWSASPGTASPTAHPEALILSAILGASSTQNYVAEGVDGVNTAGASIDVSSSVNYATGKAIGVYNNDATPVFQTGFIKSIDSESSPAAVTLATNFTGSLADNANIQGSHTSYLSTDDITQFFTIEWRSVVNNSRVLLDSCVPSSVELTLGPKGQPMISATFVCNGITPTADGSALTAASFDYPVLPAAIGNNAAKLLRGASTATAVHELSINISQTLAPKLDHNAGSGVAGLVATERTVEVSFSELLTAAPRVSVDSTEDSLYLQLSGGPGNTMVLFMGAPILTAIGDLGDADGLISQSKTFAPGSYSADDSDTAPGDTDFRVAFI